MRSPTGNSVLTYMAAFVVLAAAVGLRWLLDPVLHDALPLVTLFGAVAAAVWLGGYRPGVLVGLLGYLACRLLFIDPRGELNFYRADQLIGFAAYLFTISLIIAIGHQMRVARMRAHERGEVLRITLASIGDAVITTDLEGRVTYLNTAAETLTGWTTTEALGRPLDQVCTIVNEDTRAPVANPATRALREGVSVGLANPTVLTRRGGGECPIDDSAAPIRGDDGAISGSVLIFRDVSPQRHIDRARSHQHHTDRLLASIVETSDDAIISKSLDGVIQTWNAAAERMFGYSAAEAVGRHISLVIPAERLAEEDEIIASLKAGEQVDHFETERVRRDGQRLAVSLTVSPIKDEAGHVVGASKIVRDVTERKRLEDSLHKLAADLSDADRRKNEFIATLAHELRNPLAPLFNMLEVLKRAGGDGETLRRAHDAMGRQLGQLVRLVDDLLDLNRITHNRLELRRTHVELTAVLHQAIETSRPLIDSAGHELRVVLPDQPCHLYADAARLAQVFGNLLNNSSKYTDGGGTIWVTAECQADDVVVSIRDTGFGIPQDKLDSIFEMFTQIDRSVERSPGGLGIGLTLVRQLVNMHGGSVEAKSAGEGQGSEFLVRLPRVETPTATVPSWPSSASA